MLPRGIAVVVLALCAISLGFDCGGKKDSCDGTALAESKDVRLAIDVFVELTPSLEPATGQQVTVTTEKVYCDGTRKGYQLATGHVDDAGHYIPWLIGPGYTFHNSEDWVDVVVTVQHVEPGHSDQHEEAHPVSWDMVATAPFDVPTGIVVEIPSP